MRYILITEKRIIVIIINIMFILCPVKAIAMGLVVEFLPSPTAAYKGNWIFRNRIKRSYKLS